MKCKLSGKILKEFAALCRYLTCINNKDKKVKGQESVS